MIHNVKEKGLVANRLRRNDGQRIGRGEPEMAKCPRPATAATATNKITVKIAVIATSCK